MRITGEIGDWGFDWASQNAYNLAMNFVWDPDKAANNLKKHKVSFQEAATVFGDFLSVTFEDPDHSVDEERYITIGVSDQGRLLVVSHTDRNDTIRIISARRVTSYERRYYEAGK